MVSRTVALSVVGIALLFFFLTFGWVNVHPTEVAVEVDKVAGEVKAMPRGVGYHFFNRWVTDMVLYRVNARSFPSQSMATEGMKEYNMDLKTNDGQNVSVDLTVLYALDANKIPELHKTVGQNYEDQILLPEIRSEARLAIGRYSAEQLYQGEVRTQIQAMIKEKLSESLTRYPAIMIQDTLLRHFAFSPAFEGAIESKKMAAQQVEINKNLAFAQEEMAKQQEAESRGLKLKAVQEAEGRAQSVKIEADAQRYQLEQEAAGNLAIYKSEAEGKRLLAEALGGGQNVVALKFAEMLPPKLEVWGIPVGANNTSLMDISGVFGEMFKTTEK